MQLGGLNRFYDLVLQSTALTDNILRRYLYCNCIVCVFDDDGAAHQSPFYATLRRLQRMRMKDIPSPECLERTEQCRTRERGGRFKQHPSVLCGATDHSNVNNYELFYFRIANCVQYFICIADGNPTQPHNHQPIDNAYSCNTLI